MTKALILGCQKDRHAVFHLQDDLDGCITFHMRRLEKLQHFRDNGVEMACGKELAVLGDVYGENNQPLCDLLHDLQNATDEDTRQKIFKSFVILAIQCVEDYLKCLRALRENLEKWE